MHEGKLILMIKENRKTCTILEVRKLTETTSVLRFERDDLEFEPGQSIRVGLANDPDVRDYSIYSGSASNYVEVLVRRIDDGLVSKQLCDLKSGDDVSVGDSRGYFLLPPTLRNNPLLFIATGTGISPYHSFLDSYPGLNYRLIHGTALLEEAYESDFYGDNYVHCVSREEGGDFQGRVTEYLQTLEIPWNTHIFLCGNCDMIHQVFDLLRKKGLPTAQIFSEVYF